jgi:ribosomal protein L37AE/L43A
MTSSGLRTDLLRCPNCLRRFLVRDATRAAAWACPACEHELQLMVRSIPGPPVKAAQVLSAEILTSFGEIRT